MGLPLWPNYKEEEQKLKTKNTVKTDPTAAARSSIRRRAQRGADDSDHRARARFLERAAERTANSETRDAQGPAGQTRRSAHSRRERIAQDHQSSMLDRIEQNMRNTIPRIEDREREQAQAREMQDIMLRGVDELNSQSREVPRLRRETTRSSGFTGPEARPATLPTPPLEADSSGGATHQSLPTLPTAPRHGETGSESLVDMVASARDLLETTRRELDGLGDRMRSMSAGDDIGDHWEITRTTTSEDETLATADSSFAGTIAADSLASADPAQTIGDDGWPSEYTSATEPTQGALREPQTEECWDYYSESDDAYDVEPGSRPLQTNIDVAQEISSTSDHRRANRFPSSVAHREQQREFRRRQASQLRSLDQYALGHGFDARGPSPGAQRPDRYGAELLQRSRDAANDVREFVRREALHQRSEASTRLSQIADTRSDMQSSADLLGTFSESMRHDDNDLEAMRGIVQRMVAREDIPDEFWMSAGLSRDTVRSAAPAPSARRRSQTFPNGMRVVYGRTPDENDIVFPPGV